MPAAQRASDKFRQSTQTGRSRRVGLARRIAVLLGFGVAVACAMPGFALAADVTAPDLRSLAISPATVDSSAAPRTVMVTARITDAGAGNAGPGYQSSPSQAYFTNPSGQSMYAMLSGYERISGTAQDGVYEYAMTVRQGAASGAWTITYLMLVDQVGNTRRYNTAQLQTAGYPTSFEQTGAGDTTAPDLTSLAISPATVDSSAAPRTVTVTARITDAGAGNAGPGYQSSPSQAYFTNPSGQSMYAMLSGYERISGTAQDGVYEYAMTVRQGAASGAWTITYLMLVDQVGNTRRYNRVSGRLGGDAPPVAIA